MLLAAGWGLGYLIDTFDWKRLTTSNGLLAVLLIPVLIAASAGVLSGLMGSNLPFQGNTLEQLQATSRFIISLIATLMSAVGILYLLRDWRPALILQLATAAFFTLLTVLTARAAYRASYINYDQATEYLVYAHAARGPKDALDQIEEISRRVSGGKDIMVAYSNDGLYPYWWYLRDYPNHRWFQDNVTRDLRDYPIIIAGEDVFSKIDSLVAESYIRYDYMRLWWPNQDYMNLTWERIWGAIRDPNMRAAIFDIWLNRDYTEYARLTSKQKEFDLETWSPGAQMRLYIRKDIIAQIWNYGASPAVPSAEEIDPYEQNMVELETRMVIGSTGSSLGQLQAPRGIKVAPDGSIYVADSKNHRIQQFSPNGDALRAWGSFADQASGDAPGGTFNEPWDVAVGPDGSVYVSDTWNHRVQKFTGSGEFISMWGYFGQGEAPEAFWGPRGLGVDADGRVYVMDTGNDRVVVFDAEGNFISQFGTEGFDRGQLDEPVGIAIDQQDGKVFISDTWNQRIQVFVSSANAQIFTPVLSWDVKAWLGESLENKPFLALSPVNDHLFIVDPEASRVLEFTQEGDFVRGWGDYSDGADGFGLASGVAVTQDGQVWVSDGANNRLLLFEPPLE
jgi:DNA-binding beta-propeller fold protein YncE